MPASDPEGRQPRLRPCNNDVASKKEAFNVVSASENGVSNVVDTLLGLPAGLEFLVRTEDVIAEYANRPSRSSFETDDSHMENSNLIEPVSNFRPERIER